MLVLSRTIQRCILIAASMMLFAACGPIDDASMTREMAEGERWLSDRTADLPLWLSDTGIYDNLRTLTPSATFIAYTPRFELHSHGAGKHRLISVPANMRIGFRTDGSWRFPVGTVAVKTFTMDGIEGRIDAVAIETRVIVRRPTGWVYAVYHWNADGTQAKNLGATWTPVHFYLLGEKTIPYEIPGHLDCQACHETHPDSVLLGWSPLNFDPSMREHRIFEHPPSATELPAQNKLEARAMGFLIGNCTHCHHGRNQANENASFSLRPNDLIQHTVGVETESSASGIGIRVVPGNPERSALYQAAVDAMAPNYDGDLKRMPPVGRPQRSQLIADILGDWIRTL
ncbi:MAG: hypothetical protein VX589_12880 [Myxococcota bacterium]|nr:hypothetical protein [Myxococcota bacterium]